SPRSVSSPASRSTSSPARDGIECSVWSASRLPGGRMRGAAMKAHESAQVGLVAVVFALFVRTFLFQAFVVPSSSMERTVLVGDHLLVNKFLFAPHLEGPLAGLLPYRQVRRGDVVVFKFPENPRRDFVKRAVALPGDLLEIRDKEVFV